MYSTNGRKKNGNKETAKVKTTKILICEACGYTEVGRAKEFGEQAICSKCGSINTRFE